MRRTIQVEQRFRQEHAILDRIYSILPVGKPTTTSYERVAEQLGISAHAMVTAKRSFESAGILDTKLEYVTGVPGRTSVWTLALPLETAHDELSREHDRQLAKPSRKAERRGRVLPSSDGSGVLAEKPRALSIPDAESLIEDARKYMARLDNARRTIEQLRRDGIEVDDGAVKFARHERLEIVARLLPYVDSLEQERDRALEQADRWKPKDQS